MLTPDSATPFGAGSACAAMRDKNLNYPGRCEMLQISAKCCRPARVAILARSASNRKLNLHQLKF